MRTIFRSFIILLITLTACVNKETATFITGRFPDSPNNTLNLVPVDDYFPGLGTNNIIASTKTDSLGTFTFEINQIKSGFFQITKNKYPVFRYDIFLEKGDSIHIDQSSWNEEPRLSISGKGSEKLQYLMEDYKIFPNDKAFKKKLRSKKFTTALSFKNFIDSIQNIRINTLNHNTTTPEKLKVIFKNDIYAESAKLLLHHLERRNYIMTGSFDYYYPDSSYYSFLNNLKFDNSFCHSTALKKMASYFLTSKSRIAFEKEEESRYWKENLSWKFNYISNQSKSIWTDILALSTINDYSFGLMQDDFFDDLKNFNNKMNSLFYSKSYHQIFKNSVSDYFILSPGMPAPDFALPDSNGNIIHLSDFKGKIVYIDFWGTWCYPCIQEIPKALKLQKDYKNKPVIFLYVALEYDEKNIANWKNFIAGKDEHFAKLLDYKPFPGIHVVAEKQFYNKNIKPYKLSFVPTYVLIDQNGNIVKARAARPEDISKQINKLLEK